MDLCQKMLTMSMKLFIFQNGNWINEFNGIKSRMQCDFQYFDVCYEDEQSGDILTNLYSLDGSVYYFGCTYEDWHQQYAQEFALHSKYCAYKPVIVSTYCGDILQ